MFTTEYESANKVRDLIKAETDLNDKPRAESNSGSDDCKQVEADFILGNRVRNIVPSGSDSNLKKKTRARLNQANLSWKQSTTKIMPAHLVLNLNQVGQSDPKPTDNTSLSPTPLVKLKPLPSHLKYAYLGNDQQFPIMIANNLHQEQEHKLLHVLRQHKKAIGWKLSDLRRINPVIYMHRILVEKAHPIRQQQRRLNSAILDMVKKEVTKLLAAGIINPISNS
ncbi:hypothetical protein CR513_42274, partial [Mucuna pruriens]